MIKARWQLASHKNAHLTFNKAAATTSLWCSQSALKSASSCLVSSPRSGANEHPSSRPAELSLLAHMRREASTQTRRVPFSTQPICGCNNCKMRTTSRDSHKEMCFTSLSWRKHPRVMTTSVRPATTTKLIKRRRLTSQHNPHKWWETTCEPTICKERGQRAKVYPLSHPLFVYKEHSFHRAQ